MSLKLKDLAKTSDRLVGGHRACAGCAAPIALRMTLKAIESNVVVGFATGCMEVATTIYPYTAWKVPYIHTAFENVAATISGVESAYESLKAQGKIKKDIKFVAFGGDGGTYDIGLQSLSGALERGHNFLYICYDNEGYMNTGIQRSGSTPYCAQTNTSPVGKVQQGKPQWKKDLTAIVVAHHIPYVAQASVSNWLDYMKKVRKAVETQGPAFINVFTPCHRGWRIMPDDSINFAKLAVDTCFWPLFEVENGKWKLNYRPKKKLPITEYLQKQGRFKHLFKEKNKYLIDEIQKEIDKRWEELLKKTC